MKTLRLLLRGAAAIQDRTMPVYATLYDSSACVIAEGEITATASSQQWMHEHFIPRLLEPGHRALPPEVMEEGGGLLSDWLLPQPIRQALRRFLVSSGSAPNSDASILLGLAFTDLALAEFPWEFAFIPSVVGENDPLAGFLALHPLLYLCREVPSNGYSSRSPIRTRQGTINKIDTQESTNSKLRVLIAGANPATDSYPHLPHLDGEMESVIHALTRSPECRNSIQVDVVRHASPAALQYALREKRPHILHLMAHSEPRPSGPAMIFQGEVTGKEAPLYLETLQQFLHGQTLRLLILSACGSPKTAYAFADGLVHESRVAALIAMQLPLRDSIARLFSRALYGTLAEGASVSDAVWQARQAIQGAGADWGAATLWVPPLAGKVGKMLSDAVAPPLQPHPADPSTDKPIDKPSELLESERPFIGRDRVVTDICALLGFGEEDCSAEKGSNTARLITITGIGGMGKTTLARHCARLAISAFATGVRFVELDALNGREEIASALCGALDIPPQTGENAIRALSTGPRFPLSAPESRRLIVLDCFERHLAQADLVEILLRRRPDLTCLVTSRVVLGLPREHEYPLLPMDTPQSDTSPVAGTRSPQAADEMLTESALLFAEAATHAASGFTLTAENRPLVEALCRRLEGIPLSLVLAAGRLRHLSLEDLRDQIETAPLRILRRRLVGEVSADRHAALQQVIAGSFHLLPPAERWLLRQLSVFVGGFGLSDVLAICVAPPDGDILEGVGHLRDHSLLQTRVRSDRTVTRYYLLDTVREYLAEMPDSSEESVALADCRRRHCAHYTAVAQTLYEGMRQKDWVATSERLRENLGNLRQAITQAIAERIDDLLISLADTLARLFGESGLWSDFDLLTTAALEAHERVDDHRRHMRLLAYRAQMARRRGAENEARLLMERMVVHYERSGDGSGQADILFELASQARDLGESERAQSLLDRMEQICRGSIPLDDLLAQAQALRAELYLLSGQPETARRYVDKALSLLNSEADLDAVLLVCMVGGRVLRLLQSFPDAESTLRRGLETATLGNRTFGVSRALLELGLLYEQAGDLARAVLSYLAATRIHAGLDAQRHTEATAALTLFRRRHRGSSLLQKASRESRKGSWQDQVARLLLMPPLS